MDRAKQEMQNMVGSRVRKMVFSDASFLDDAQMEDDNREILRLLRDNAVQEKLEGLKRLIALMSVGRDVSSFFPTVVINIATQSFEVKNLVYIYLVRYAEHRPDEALLSVNSFQKDLTHPNPRVRALALRVLSSIRVHVIVPVVVLAIKKCSVDPSPYVRKAAAHAVPKMFRLDRSAEDELVEVIEHLLRDNAPMVLSSAVAAFLEVCPGRLELIHRHYRKLCCLMVDTDEWGQILLASLLLRYARSQFLPADAMPREGLPLADAPPMGFGSVPGSPGSAAGGTPYAAHGPAAGSPFGQSPFGHGPFDQALSAEPAPQRPERDLQTLLRAGDGFYEDDEQPAKAAAEPAAEKPRKGKKGAGGGAKAAEKAPPPATPEPPPPPPPPVATTAAAAPEAEAQKRAGELDEDHRLLLRCSRPLLQSRNAGVVLATASLQWYLGPASELPRVAKALVFALRSSPEAQHVLLQNIVSMVALAPALFAPFFQSFFVFPRDSHAVRALKLEVLTHVVSPANADRLLQELQICLRDPSKPFVVLAVRAIGRVAARLPHIAASCLRSLMELSSHPLEEVAAEAVVVIRALIQQRPAEHCGVIARLVRRLDQLRAPPARAAVVWLAAWEHAGPGEAPPAEGSDAAKLLKIAPEAMRQVARTFCEEAEEVKLQLLGSCAKIYLRTPKAVGLLYRHVLELCAVDASYDVRDRARLLRALLPPPAEDGTPPPAPPLGAHAAAILFCAKPTPPLPSPAPARGVHTLGTLSHTVQHTAPGYLQLPPHPEVPPPSHTRAAPVRPIGVAAEQSPHAAGALRQSPHGGGAEGFFSSSGSSSYSSSYTSSGSGSSSASASGSDSEGEEEEAEEAAAAAPAEAPAADDPKKWDLEELSPTARDAEAAGGTLGELTVADGEEQEEEEEEAKKEAEPGAAA